MPASAELGIRMRILAFVKARDQAYVPEVAAHFGVTHEGARKQLARLEREGWMESRLVQDGVGRPRHVYHVTAAGDHQLPKAYDRFSLALLARLREGNATLQDTLAALTRDQVAAWKPKLEGKTLPEKLEILRNLYATDDPFTSVEIRDGEIFLTERNCPYLAVAMEHPAMCSVTVNTLSALLDRPVTRTERFQDGHGRCVFRCRV